MGKRDQFDGTSAAESPASGLEETLAPRLVDKRPLDPTAESWDRASSDVTPANTLPAEANVDVSSVMRGPAESSLVAVPGAIPTPLLSWDRYEILRPLGQGGMGTVFLARDRRLGRLVGLKFLRLPNPEAAERMMQEARAQARLDHKGICKVFEVGDFQGQPYIAMEYLNGQPLNAALRRLTLEQKVVLLIEIALAVHAAHCQGVLHRDLKPANIMVCTTGDDGSGRAAGELRPVLMDFGLARDSLAGQRLTQTGMIMGTPAYMSPEQARGNARHLDRRADVYSLGAVMYELLIGRPPFNSESEVELLLAVLEQDPAPPRLIEPTLPLDLEVITLKCLCKEPERRYESALALAEDLQRYLRGEPIAARPPSALYRLRRFAVRHLAAVAVSVVILCSFAALLGMAVRARTKEEAAARRADRQRRLAGELGQSVASMNSFLRVAYSLPVHDLEREQVVVRQQLSKLEAQSVEIDDFLRATLEGAIGRGYLALHEDKQAMTHLQLALQFGDTAPDVHLALGQALGRLHDQEARDVRRRFQRAQAKPRLDELRQQYLVPALSELELGKESPQIEPLYVQALIHYYKGDAEYEQALKAARAAHKAAPWLIEPLELESKIVSLQCREQLQSGHSQAIKQAAVVRESLERAIGIARSYPEFYSSLADFVASTLRLKVALNLDIKELEPLFISGVRHTKQAIELLPHNSEAYDQLAEILAQWANVQAGAGLDPGTTIEQALAAVDSALAKKPERARSYFARARTYLAQASYQVFLDTEPLLSYEQTATDCRRAASLDPNHGETWVLLTLALREVAEIKLAKGLPIDKECDETEQACKRAILLSPELPTPKSNLADFYILRARHSVTHGRDPSTYLASAQKLLDEVLTKNPEHLYAQLNRVSLHQEEVHRDLSTRHDATARAREVVAEVERLRSQHRTLPELVELESSAYAALGDALFQQGASPMPALKDGLDALARVEAAALPAAKQAQLRCELLLRQAAWLAASKRAPEPAVQAVLQATAQLEKLTGAMRSELLAQRAKALRLRATWELSQGRSQAALATMDAGLAVCATVRAAARAGLVPCKIEEGILSALKAQLLRNPGERAALAQRAAATLRALIEDQPPLEHELGRYIQSSLALLGRAGALGAPGNE